MSVARWAATVPSVVPRTVSRDQTLWTWCSGRGARVGSSPTDRRRISSATAIARPINITPAAHSSESDTAVG